MNTPKTYKKELTINGEKELTTELKEVASKIRGLISKSALAKIEIGELLNEHTKEIEHGGKKEFYTSIGMSDRTAQYYMKIASSQDVQELKKENKLDGLNMSEILALVGMRVNIRGANNDDAPREEYVPLGFGKFDSDRCRSTKQFKVEYKALADKVSELEDKLKKLKTQSA